MKVKLYNVHFLWVLKYTYILKVKVIQTND